MDFNSEQNSAFTEQYGVIDFDYEFDFSMFTTDTKPEFLDSVLTTETTPVIHNVLTTDNTTVNNTVLTTETTRPEIVEISNISTILPSDDYNELLTCLDDVIPPVKSLNESGYQSPDKISNTDVPTVTPNHNYNAILSTFDDVSKDIANLERRLVTSMTRHPHVRPLQDFFQQMTSLSHDADEIRKAIERVSQSLDLVDQLDQVAPQVTNFMTSTPDVTSRKRKRQDDTTMSGKRFFSQTASAILESWYREHHTNPYPSEDTMVKLAEQCQLSMGQLKKWFANKRSRDCNTKPKRKYVFYGVAHGLHSLCSDDNSRMF